MMMILEEGKKNKRKRNWRERDYNILLEIDLMPPVDETVSSDNLCQILLPMGIAFVIRLGFQSQDICKIIKFI